jgi:hypothetical protein
VGHPRACPSLAPKGGPSPRRPGRKFFRIGRGVPSPGRGDEAKDIRDKAVALQAYARQAQDRDMIGWATEIKVRAERRTGELLRETAKHPGFPGPGRGKKTPSSCGEGVLPPKLKELGISHDQSSDWQQLAEIPAPEFERRIAEAKHDPASMTSTRSLLASLFVNVRRTTSQRAAPVFERICTVADLDAMTARGRVADHWRRRCKRIGAYPFLSSNSSSRIVPRNMVAGNASSWTIRKRYSALLDSR